MSYFKKKSAAGLTLIEVLISMVILAVGILSVMAMLTTAAKGNAEARKMTRALHIAENKMDEFLYGGKNCSDIDGSKDGYEWTSSSSSSPPNGTSHCEVTVSWTSSGKQRQVALETLRSE